MTKQAKVTGSQPACSHPVVTTGQLTTATDSWFVAVPPTESVSLVWLNDVPMVSGYLALKAMNPFTMSWFRTVYVTPVSVVMSGNDVGAPRHSPRPPLLAEFGSFVVPPTHGMLVVWSIPSGVVNMRFPPSKAQVGTLVVLG